MADKKNPSRAERAVSEVKKNTGSSNSKASSKSKPKKNSTGSKKPTKAEKAVSNSSVPVSLICIALFALFAVLSINPEGAVLQLIKAVLFGFLGQAGFYFSIPALLYLFLINTFGRRTSVKMRSICTVIFVLLCGCIFHLTVQTQGVASGINLIPDLYLSGVDGFSGGIVCGGIALLMKWACGRWAALLICVLAAFLTLLAAMDITVPSIIRAIANRPRDEVDEDEEQEYIEPAALVVNHIANKRIEKKRQHNSRLEGVHTPNMAELDTLPKSVPQQNVKKIQKPKQPVPQPAAISEENTVGTPSRASGVMSTIDLDINAPVFASGQGAIPVMDENEILTGSSQGMPELNLDVAPPSFVMAKEEPAEPKVRPMPKAAMEPVDSKPEKKKDKVTANDTETSAQQVAAEIEMNQAQQQPDYCFPPMDLLKMPVRGAAEHRRGAVSGPLRRGEKHLRQHRDGNLRRQIFGADVAERRGDRRHQGTKHPHRDRRAGGCRPEKLRPGPL